MGIRVLGDSPNLVTASTDDFWISQQISRGFPDLRGGCKYCILVDRTHKSGVRHGVAVVMEGVHVNNALSIFW